MPTSSAFHLSAHNYSYSKSTTPFVILACITAASGGLIFGYDLGISGGVTSMDDFLLKFFPKVYRQRHAASTDNYCKFDSQVLTMFTSSLYLSGFITSLFASITTRNYGRRASILTGGVCFVIGSSLNGAAQDLAMLITGRIMLGVGIGFTNQAVPLYLSEIAPPKLRGCLNSFFQIAAGFGALCAFVTNYGTQKIAHWGWRLSLGLAFVPAIFLTIGSLFLPDSPSSLVQRGYPAEGREVLAKLRGTADVQAEFDDLAQAVELSKAVTNPWRNITLRKYRPQLVMAFAVPFFQQATGINMIVFYAPMLFQTLGFGADSSLYSAAILGVLSLLSFVIAAGLVDRVGRRKLFQHGGWQMFASLVLTGLLVQWKVGAHNTVAKQYGIVAMVLINMYVASFGWSWGPLGWLVPSEIFPLEIRSAGQSINICVIMLSTYVTAQAFLAMLCHFKAGLFFFFAGWVMIMTLFMHLLFPETKGVPLEHIADVWKTRPLWAKFFSE